MICRDSHGVPICLSQIPGYYAMGFLSEEDAREYKRSKEKILQRTNEETDMLLNRNRDTNLAAIQVESLNILSKYANTSGQSIFDRAEKQTNPESNLEHMIRQPTIQTPTDFLLRKNKKI